MIHSEVISQQIFDGAPSLFAEKKKELQKMIFVLCVRKRCLANVNTVHMIPSLTEDRLCGSEAEFVYF